MLPEGHGGYGAQGEMGRPCFVAPVTEQISPEVLARPESIVHARMDADGAWNGAAELQRGTGHGTMAR